MLVTATAHQKFVRHTPRKVRLVADVIRGSNVNKALDQLKVTPKQAAQVLEKVLKQAKANAINNQNAQEETLKIQEIQIQEGPMLKRWQPVSRGRAHSIHKRMSHIRITVTGDSKQ